MTSLARLFAFASACCRKCACTASLSAAGRSAAWPPPSVCSQRTGRPRARKTVSASGTSAAGCTAVARRGTSAAKKVAASRASPYEAVTEEEAAGDGPAPAPAGRKEGISGEEAAPSRAGGNRTGCYDGVLRWRGHTVD